MARIPGCYCDQLPEQTLSQLSAVIQAGSLLPTDAETADIVILGRHSDFRADSDDAATLYLIEAGHPDAELANFLIPENFPPAFLRNALTQVIRHWQLQQQADSLNADSEFQQRQFERLMSIGIALSAEQDHQRLLALIVREAREFASCDAASIFLIEPGDDGSEQLVFKLTQNDSVAFDVSEQRFPLDRTSLAGFAALSGEVLNFSDVYRLPQVSPYRFNKAFDLSTGYRTRSMLVIPMKRHDGRVVGVIQFINRKKNRQQKLTTAQLCKTETLAFDEPLVRLLETMASQAAVAIENNQLLEQINNLFEGFVRASVHAIEQRDPTTSGHSFRVADLTVALAEAVDSSRQHELASLRFSSEQMRELRYAALLHDFGKVGVREHVLVKARKLTPESWLRFQYRIELQRERVMNHFLRQRLALQREHRLSSEREEQLHQQEAQALQRLQAMKEAVTLANEPSVLGDDTFESLKALCEERFTDADGQDVPLLDDHDFLALAVRRGSLTDGERREIESHVSHTIRFLETIPWTTQLSSVPLIAGAHHEKLDGSGYPYGLKAADIPPGAKIMAICDIFDALTATDRPYKPAVPLEKALDIIVAESRNGKLDAAMTSVFTCLPLTAIVPSIRTL